MTRTSNAVDHDATVFAVMDSLDGAIESVVRKLCRDYEAEIERIERAVETATTLQQAQKRVLGVTVPASSRAGDLKCCICGDGLPPRKRAYTFNYCQKTECRREQQRRNQAMWRARRAK